MENSKQYGIFEQVEFLNEGIVGTGILLTIGGIALASEIKKKIKEHKDKKSGSGISNEEFNKIMSNFKSLAKKLDGLRTKICQYKWIEDDQPNFNLQENYFDIFIKNFNKGNSIQPMYLIVFKESDYDNPEYNWEDTMDFFEKNLKQFCIENGFKNLDWDQDNHRYLLATESDKYNGFEIKFYSDTHFEISIEYSKKVIKKK